MTKAEIGHFRRRLLALKKRIGGDLTELEEETLKPVGGESSGGLSDVPLHPADLGTGEFEEELTLTLVENEEHLLAEINDALDRIEQGTYTRCENCHREISRERLEALPYVRYCIRCARKLQGQASE
jgi:RNA polymerase-binding protein DksA